MLQYLVILLDDTAVSFCHYENYEGERRLISPENLQAGIMFAMKQNLMIQLVYPDYELPESHRHLIERIDHHNIMPVSLCNNADAVAVDDWKNLPDFRQEKPIVALRTDKRHLFAKYEKLADYLQAVSRLNVIITDIETFTDADFETYKTVLSFLQSAIKTQYRQGVFPQLNLLTDRILLNKMNNCNAGTETITLAPNGKFYICPAFYYEDETDSVGNLIDGLQIPNKQLYRLDFAPLCRICDAWQCKRCVWLNRKTTLEVNTPSREQCVVAHLERNASRALLNDLHKFFPDKEIKKLEVLDTFELIIKK